MRILIMLSVPITLLFSFFLYRRFQKYTVTKNDVAFWPAGQFWPVFVLFLLGEAASLFLYFLADSHMGAAICLAITYCIGLPTALQRSKEKMTQLPSETFQYTNFLGKTTIFSLADVLDAQIGSNPHCGVPCHSIKINQKSIVLGSHMHVEDKFWNRMLFAARRSKKSNEITK